MSSIIVTVCWTIWIGQVKYEMKIDSWPNEKIFNNSQLSDRVNEEREKKRQQKKQNKTSHERQS